MLRNVSELKSGGGGNSYVVPHPEKWGWTVPPRSPPIDVRASISSRRTLPLFIFKREMTMQHPTLDWRSLEGCFYRCCEVRGTFSKCLCVSAEVPLCHDDLWTIVHIARSLVGDCLPSWRHVMPIEDVF